MRESVFSVAEEMNIPELRLIGGDMVRGAKGFALLCRGNESSMFVTLFCGILNLRTGELRYSNAGHNPSLLLKPGKEPEWLPLPPGIVLG